VGEVARGDVVVSAGAELKDTYLIDAELQFEGLRARARDRVQIHHGTREAPARLAWLGGRFWQLRLEQPLIPAAGTGWSCAGSPRRTRSAAAGSSIHIRASTGRRDLLAGLERLARGEQEPAAEPEPRAPNPRNAPSEPASLSASALELEARLLSAGLEPPLESELDARDLAALAPRPAEPSASPSRPLPPDTIATVKRLAIESAERHGGSITIGPAARRAGNLRKFAQALLEHLNAERVTIRRGDQHFLRRRQASA